MKPTEIKQALDMVGGRANKRLGQHFLIDKTVLQTIIQAADIKPGDVVLEIGPGLGVLTRALLDQGAEIMAIEQDRRFVEYLKSLTMEHGTRNINIIHGDAAIVHWHELIGERPWKFVSNLPYGITSLALRKALWAPKPPNNVVVLVQREVGERIVAKRGKTSLLSLMAALAAESSRIVKRVPAGCFYPAPQVESVVLQIVPMPWAERVKRWGMNPEKIMEVAKLGFAHPRKLLRSNLSLAIGSSLLSKIGLDEKIRAEDLSPDDWAHLARAISGER